MSTFYFHQVNITHFSTIKSLCCFQHENRFLPQHEWDKIDAPAMERRLNFHPEQVKLVKDMDSHITYCYRIKPEIDNL